MAIYDEKSESTSKLSKIPELELLPIKPLGSISSPKPTQSKIFDIKPIFTNGYITSYELSSYANKLILKVITKSYDGELTVAILKELLGF